LIPAHHIHVNKLDIRILRVRSLPLGSYAEAPNGAPTNAALGLYFHASMVGMSEFEDQALGFLVRGLMARLRPHAVQALRPLGLGLPEFVCMRILDEDPGRTSAELARHTHVTAQAMNQVLQGLQEVGLVTRPATAPSGRALPAQLTRKGSALLRRAEAAVASSDEHLLAHLSPADRRQLKALLYRAGNPSPDDSSVCAPSDGAG
jgi:DNA-binding MarR family transcriptional regulator